MRPGLRTILIASVLLAAAAIATLVLADAWQWAGSPGPMSKGHVDLACAECHVTTDTGHARMNETCLDCHRDAMGATRNAHSPAYFDVVGLRATPWQLDSSDCLDCHRGHQRPTDRSAMTFMPTGFCEACHADVQQSVRAPEFVADHRSFDFNSCQGCHGFHARTLFKPQARDH